MLLKVGQDKPMTMSEIFTKFPTQDGFDLKSGIIQAAFRMRQKLADPKDTVDEADFYRMMKGFSGGNIDPQFRSWIKQEYNDIDEVYQLSVKQCNKRESARVSIMGLLGSSMRIHMFIDFIYDRIGNQEIGNKRLFVLRNKKGAGAFTWLHQAINHSIRIRCVDF